MLAASVRQDVLEEYLFLKNSALVRVFSLLRWTNGDAWMRGEAHEEIVRAASGKICARRLTVKTSDASDVEGLDLKGAHIVRRTRTDDEMREWLVHGYPRPYASFTIQDFKHGVVVDYSADPAGLGNYFVESDLPFETSPAYFSPDVLYQYKADPSHYTITDRHITCKGAWDLRYADNDAGQIMVYICDLALLPYEEQLHWKAHNEAPKAGVSNRVYKTDFLGEWDEEYEPLRALLEALESFPTQTDSGTPSLLWEAGKPGSEGDPNRITYVRTTALKEWQDGILVLAKVIIEGLNNKTINSLSTHLGVRDKVNPVGSIKQLELLMEALGVKEEDSCTIVDPLREIQSYRSATSAHRGSKRPKGALPKHFRNLITTTDGAMRKLSALVRDGTFSATP
jgi:hypothetical protein